MMGITAAGSATRKLCPAYVQNSLMRSPNSSLSSSTSSPSQGTVCITGGAFGAAGAAGFAAAGGAGGFGAAAGGAEACGGGVAGGGDASPPLVTADVSSGFCGSGVPPGLASSGMAESELKFQGYHTPKISVNCPKFTPRASQAAYR